MREMAVTSRTLRATRTADLGVAHCSSARDESACAALTRVHVRSNLAPRPLGKDCPMSDEHDIRGWVEACRWSYGRALESEGPTATEISAQLTVTGAVYD